MTLLELTLETAIREAGEFGDVRLLKKDAEYILNLLKERPEITRCKECKHRPTYPAAYGAEINGKWCYWCELHRAWKHDDWFCADGKPYCSRCGCDVEIGKDLCDKCMYEAQVEIEEYNRMYEPTYNPEDGSM